MNIKSKREIISTLNLLDQPLRFNPFVFSKMFFLWALLGITGGIVAGIYWIVLEAFTHQMKLFTGWMVIPVMTCCGALAGLVIHWIGDPGEIHLIVNNIRFKNGKLDPKNNLSMILASLLCVGSGGSLGPEAPLVQVTGSTGSWLGDKLRLKGEHLRSMSIAGMASGFTALFGAPLGGSLFALEILHHEYAVQYYKAIIPAFVASSFSYVVFVLVVQLGIGPVWTLSTYSMSSTFDFIYAIGFALLATFLGWIFIYITKLFKKIFAALSFPIYIKTALGGLLLGLIAFYLPVVRYFGHEEINELLHHQFPVYMLVLIIVFKLLAIAITVTSGWRGGFIIPLFFIGASLGLLIHHFFPAVALSLIVVSCMAAINSCVTRTPMSTTILLSTLTGFSYLVPILFASLTGYFFAPRIPFISSQMDPSE